MGPNRYATAIVKDPNQQGSQAQPIIVDLKTCMERLESCVGAMRQDMRIYAPENNMKDERWVIILYRLEKLSLVIYIFLISLTIVMFFHHGWYA